MCVPALHEDPVTGDLHLPQVPGMLGGGRMGEVSEVTPHGLHQRPLGSGRQAGRPRLGFSPCLATKRPPVPRIFPLAAFSG